MISNLSFKPIHYTNIQVGQKYVIKTGSKLFGPWYQYIGRCILIIDGYFTFSCVTFTDLKRNYTTQRDIIMIHEAQPYTYFVLEPKKYKIYDEMELRAVNKVLQQVMGDVSFTY